ncbi:MAG: hypothetical protein M3179_15385, partial [Actinomycetota bacterium]|nr:hypothetical protein [Actinomycetota bacterium]
MPRIEIELTSSRPDGTWTWRAAGARQPKGTLDGSLLQADAKVGDVLRAETEQGIDGIHVTSVLPPKAKRAEPERLVLLGPPEREPPRRPSGDGTSVAPPRDDRRSGPRTGGRDHGPRPGGRDREPRPGGRDREPRPGGRDRGPRAAGRERDTREAGDGGPRRRQPQTRDGGHRPERSPRPAAPRESAPPRPRAKRLHPGRANREAVLAELAPEQRPVAEQVLRGGMPAVRQAVDEHNAKARAAGQPEIKGDPFLAMAEELLPRLRAAEWRDRAEAAMADVETVTLRDLRAIVTGSDAAGRDDASRTLVSNLREAVERRSAAEREKWLDEVRRSLAEGRVVRALRVSGRPPEPGQRFPADLGEQLSSAASAAMTTEVAPDRWAAVLDAVVSSPVRLSVRPEGLPTEPGEALTT